MVILVVDTQDMIMTENLYNYNEFKENVIKLIESARENSVEVIYIRHDDGIELTASIDGFDIYSDFKPENNEKVFDKNYNSAFRNTGLMNYLIERKEDEIMIVGIQTDYCIDATIKCGFEHGFTMIVPAFCNTTVSNEYMTGEESYQYYNQKMWPKRYSKCISFSEALSILKTKDL